VTTAAVPLAPHTFLFYSCEGMHIAAYIHKTSEMTLVFEPFVVWYDISQK